MKTRKDIKSGLYKIKALNRLYFIRHVTWIDIKDRQNYISQLELGDIIFVSDVNLYHYYDAVHWEIKGIVKNKIGFAYIHTGHVFELYLERIE